ncbi:MAG: 50S ribosomal protein L9 [Alphaproteobacteria bacterium]|nr:50S ribosomal protein L9 [Alphaproteobacteria bacterium]MCA0450150.1 50S ribosomal protein L9 [Pseudomonadota bacterium]
MSQMDVILLQRIESLGQMGDVVKVKPGYARNYLLPEKKALRATKANREYFDKQRAQLEANNLKAKGEAEAVAAKMGDTFSVVIIRSAGESGQLYGSVATRDVAEAVTKAGVTIGRAQVLLVQPIKELGLFKTRIALHPEVSLTITVNVAQSEEEAKLQAEGKAVRRNADADEAPAAEAAPAEAPAEAAPAESAAEEAPAAEAKPKKAKKAKKTEEA